MSIEDILCMALSGSLCYLIWKGIFLFTKKKVGASYSYRWLMLVHFLYLFPVHLLFVKRESVFLRSGAAFIKQDLLTGIRIFSRYKTWFFLIWGIGMTIYFLMGVYRIVLLKHKVKGLILLYDEALMQKIEEISKQYGVKQVPQVFVDPSAKTPYTGGLSKPFLVVTDEGNARSDMILEHEIYHIKRKDILFRYLNRIICGVFWFCPFVWFLKKDLYLLCEISCDQKILEERSAEDRVKYFRIILDCARGNIKADSSFCSFSGWMKRSALQRRVLFMKNAGRNSKKFQVITGCCMIAMMAGIVFSVSNLKPESAQSMSKLIRNNYLEQAEIPKAVEYTEYIDGSWWGGSLTYESMKYLSRSGLYQATFQGELTKLG